MSSGHERPMRRENSVRAADVLGPEYASHVIAIKQLPPSPWLNFSYSMVSPFSLCYSLSGRTSGGTSASSRIFL